MRSISDLVNDLVRRPADLTTASKYTAVNGLIYLAGGLLLLACPAGFRSIGMAS